MESISFLKHQASKLEYELKSLQDQIHKHDSKNTSLGFDNSFEVYELDEFDDIEEFDDEDAVDNSILYDDGKGSFITLTKDRRDYYDYTNDLE